MNESVHYGRWISQLLRNCFGIVAQPAPAGDDVRDLGPGEMRTPLRKRFRTFSARLAKKFRKVCVIITQFHTSAFFCEAHLRNGYEAISK
ncbi:hypothetical protein PGTUg99_025714 [Puccinia graminis f. sp. tritici]|uniref:Uncharacterized protein n=1 Tax=Puccinia graminis f. sp. tritici TaxID=56615 RepID=A0A5B0RLN4_PUCGR|nr:hypothetical protein PGTUg99_025714 [Puccinia graminis f. sp. tritici]